jgi:hypothetical protein
MSAKDQPEEYDTLTVREEEPVAPGPSKSC